MMSIYILTTTQQGQATSIYDNSKVTAFEKHPTYIKLFLSNIPMGKVTAPPPPPICYIL